MTTNTPGEGDQNTNADGAGNDVAKLQERLNAVTLERDNFKSKYRELEKTAKGATDLQKQLEDAIATTSKIQGEFETFRETVKKEKLSSHLQTALESAGAKSAQTVLKLLDQSQIKFNEDGSIDEKSVSEAVSAVKKSDPYLFSEAEGNAKPGDQNSTGDTSKQLPGVKPAAQTPAIESFRAELEAARKDKKDPFKAIEAVLQKHGKTS